ncbi:hypothetical protein PAUR_b0287 [Pseudoalteromonas aurantia 208]|uniref:Orphan protein n=1 Tax=Pseudoalteromonas aurantia 208 TaxID=1314867 RepID=A0ABR9EH11_9GAMM|nr:hypothetical protein [Pseudoalteromonas aurantia 208]
MKRQHYETQEKKYLDNNSPQSSFKTRLTVHQSPPFTEPEN